jgi:hypothetical protein
MHRNYIQGCQNVALVIEVGSTPSTKVGLNAQIQQLSRYYTLATTVKLM